jgi:hypothetical protein
MGQRPLTYVATDRADPARAAQVTLVTTSIDVRVLFFTAVVTGFTAMAFGILPAIRATGSASGGALGDGSRATTYGAERGRIRNALVIVQVALSIGLLATGWQLVATVRGYGGSAGVSGDRLLLARFDLDYVEQPCADLDGLAAGRRRVDVPVAADESVRRAEDPLKVRAADAADIVVLKVQPLGGVRAALRVAEACGLPVVVSSAVETSVGLASGVALAAALPELPYACGLATMQMLTADVTADPLLPEDGFLPVRPVVVDEGALAAVEIAPAAWRGRAAEARAAGASAAGQGNA